jgi:hypothetical protein
MSNGAQYVTPNSKIYWKKAKCVNLAQEIGFSAPNSCLGKWHNNYGNKVTEYK